MSLSLLRLSRQSTRIATPTLRQFSSSKLRSAEITLEIDGVPVTIEQGSSLIQACEKAGQSNSTIISTTIPHSV
jgi:NADH dehydrogenase (ubiquinone) Fe-S protein 1